MDAPILMRCNRLTVVNTKLAANINVTNFLQMLYHFFDVFNSIPISLRDSIKGSKLQYIDLSSNIFHACLSIDFFRFFVQIKLNFNSKVFFWKILNNYFSKNNFFFVKLSQFEIMGFS